MMSRASISLFSQGSKPVGVDCVAIDFRPRILSTVGLSAPPTLSSFPGLGPAQVLFSRFRDVHEAEISIRGGGLNFEPGCLMGANVTTRLPHLTRENPKQLILRERLLVHSRSSHTFNVRLVIVTI